MEKYLYSLYFIFGDKGDKWVMKVFFYGCEKEEKKIDDDFKKGVFRGFEDIIMEFFNVDKKFEIILNEVEKI